MPTEIAQRFLDWSLRILHETNSRTLAIIEEHANTREGRERIALSYVEPVRQRMQAILNAPNLSLRRLPQRLCLNIEMLINLFPEEERFNPPLMTLREVLIELYSSLSPNYEWVPDPEEPTPYEGPRPTRFERTPVV